MSKRFKYIIGIGIVLILLTVFSRPIFEKFTNTDTIVNKIGCRLFEFNTISVEVDSNINLNEVQIWINKRNVFKDGKQQNRIGQEYGHNIFEIYYADLLIAEVGHFRRNNWFTNQYAFEISKKGNDFILEHQINGPDAKNDNFQKRYVYDDLTNLVRIDYLNERGKVYNTEKKTGGNKTYKQ
jgi:hypothetical protein